MDIKAIIRQMLQKGMTEDEVIRNLQELGVENPEQLLSEVNSSLKPVKPAPRVQEAEALAEEEQRQQEEQPAETQDTDAQQGQNLFSDFNDEKPAKKARSAPAEEEEGSARGGSLFAAKQAAQEDDSQPLDEFSAEKKNAEDMPEGFSFTTIDGKMRERKIHVDAKAKAIAEKAMRELQALEKGVSPEELDSKIEELERAVAYLKKAFKEGTASEEDGAPRRAARKAKPNTKKR